MNRTAPPSRPPLGNAPSRFRGPFARWPRAADAVLAIAVFLAVVFLVDGPGDSIVVRPIGDVPITALLVYAVASAALYWRRRAPGRAGRGAGRLGADARRQLLADRRGGDHRPVQRGAVRHRGPVGPGGRRRGRRRGQHRSPQRPRPVGEAAFGAVVMFVAWYVGRRLRLRSERAAQLLEEQAAEARRIVIEERTRIARELHDVVAHRVSLMTVQAGAAKAVAAEDPEGALRAMAAVEEAGRQALDELRHLLGVLRPETGLDGLGPSPASRISPARRADPRGGPGRLAGDGWVVGGAAGPRRPVRVPHRPGGAHQRAQARRSRCPHPGAARQRQEGHRHRSRRRRKRLGAAFGGGRFTPTGRSPVDDRQDRRSGRSAGHGIVGMRERARLLGGTLEARPRPDGGFRVVAHLPTGGEPA